MAVRRMDVVVTAMRVHGVVVHAAHLRRLLVLHPLCGNHRHLIDELLLPVLVGTVRHGVEKRMTQMRLREARQKVRHGGGVAKGFTDEAPLLNATMIYCKVQIRNEEGYNGQINACV